MVENPCTTTTPRAVLFVILFHPKQKQKQHATTNTKDPGCNKSDIILLLLEMWVGG